MLAPSTAPSGLEVLLGETVRNIEVAVSAEQPPAISEPSVDAEWEDISTLAMISAPTTTTATTAPTTATTVSSTATAAATATTAAAPAKQEEDVDNWDDL